MKMPMFHICVYYYLVSLIGVSHGVPHPYCLAPLNRTDCGIKTTPVFSYYKPGSRCEIEYWRGCPTWNKFDSEYSCSSLCIFPLGDEVEKVQEQADNKIEPVSVSRESKPASTDSHADAELTCEGELDVDDCGGEAVAVYSFDSRSNTCIQKTWSGCESGSGNKFPDEATCITFCVTVDIRDWEEGIEDFDEEDIDEMQNIIDELLIPHEHMYHIDPTKTDIQPTDTIPESTKTSETTPSTTTPTPTTESEESDDNFGVYYN